MGSLQEIYAEEIQPFENGDGVFLIRTTMDESIVKSNIRLNVMKTKYIHSIVDRPGQRTEIWGFMFSLSTSKATMDVYINEEKNRKFAVAMSMYKKYYTPVMMLFGPDALTDNHAQAYCQSLLSLQTTFDLLHSNTAPKLEACEFGSVRLVYALSLVLAMKYYETECDNEEDNLQYLKNTMEWFGSEVGIDLTFTLTAINQASRDYVMNNLGDVDSFEEVSHYLSMQGISSIASMTRFKSSMLGYAGFGIAPTEEQFKRAKESLVWLEVRCKKDTKLVTNEISAIFSLNTSVIERMMKMKAHRGFAKVQCEICEKELHPLSCLVGNSFLNLAGGWRCNKCQGGDDFEKTEKTNDLFEEERKQWQDNVLAMKQEFDKEKMLIHKQFTKEKKEITKQLKKTHNTQLAEVICKNQRQVSELLKQIEALTTEISGLRDETMSLRCDNNVILGELTNIEHKAYHDDILKILQQEISRSNILLSSKDDEVLRLKNELKTTKEFLDEKEELQRQHTILQKNMYTANEQDKAKQKTIDNLSNELEVTISVFKSSLDEAKHTVNRDYNEDKRCAEAWKERNAILTGEVKAAWTAYEKLLKSSSLC